MLDFTTDSNCCKVASLLAGSGRSPRTSTPPTTTGGKLVFHRFGSLAEFQSNLIRDRIMADLSAARAQGRVDGRPPSRPTKLAVARQMQASRQHAMEAFVEGIDVSQATPVARQPDSHVAPRWHPGPFRRRRHPRCHGQPNHFRQGHRRVRRLRRPVRGVDC